MSSKILVTGGAGFIGSHIVDRLMGEGFSVRVVDNLSSGRLENIEQWLGNHRFEFFRGDLKSYSDALEAVKGVDVVFHFAANPEVRVSTTNPRVHFEENVVATFNLLEAMRERGVKEIIFASSSSVYGEPETIPVDENAPMKPVSVYGASKAACENLIHSYSKLYGIKAVILRYANVIGPRLRHGVIYDLLMKIKRSREVLEVLGDGTQTRSYIYIADAVEATIAAWRNSREEYNVYNVGSEDWITVREVVNIILSELRLDNVRIVYRPVLHGVGWPGDVKRIALAIDKLKKLEFTPRHKSREAVAKTVRELAKELL
ncbi:MAG: NAD-dependent epimerase/dehydratase family protein [Sulfolobales archaeon]|uniref:NAD-dependent epimerase/dehydratase family protein n=1 Tax=Thermoprotei TaxID=183924 RepID=UPI0031618E8E